MAGAVTAGTTIPRRRCFLLTTPATTDRPWPPLVKRRRVYLLMLLVKFINTAGIGGALFN
jgi:hypothetical protein